MLQENIDQPDNQPDNKKYNCPICFEEIEYNKPECNPDDPDDPDDPDNLDAIFFNCKHYVCTSCTIEMIIHKTFKKCPLCRQRITLDPKYIGIIELIQSFKQECKQLVENDSTTDASRAIFTNNATQYIDMNNPDHADQEDQIADVETASNDSFETTVQHNQNIQHYQHNRYLDEEANQYHQIEREPFCETDVGKCITEFFCSIFGIFLLYILFLRH